MNFLELLLTACEVLLLLAEANGQLVPNTTVVNVRSCI